GAPSRISGLGAHSAPARSGAGHGAPASDEPGFGAEPRLVKGLTFISSRPSRRLRTASLLAALGGAILFAWSMQHAGTTTVVDGFRRVGGGIVIVVVFGGVRALVRTAAWRVCLDPEDHLALRSMFTAYLAGDAIGNVTPFGLIASEQVKIAR